MVWESLKRGKKIFYYLKAEEFYHERYFLEHFVWFLVFLIKKKIKINKMILLNKRV